MTAERVRNPVFVALDTPEVSRAVDIAARVLPHVGGLKIGLEFLAANGPDGVKKIVELGLPVFADTKFHDIPNTVAGASREIAALGISMFNVHASGGTAMLRAAREAVSEVDPRVKLIAVTVLTSMDGTDVAQVGQRGPLEAQVVRLAELASAAKLDGVVCGASEIQAVRRATGPDFLIVVPGIRPRGSAMHDQRRSMTPAEALRVGADILVVGRPITAASDPAEAARAIVEELAETAA
jgi:orotidine-5'-phosphate decarboxylase